MSHSAANPANEALLNNPIWNSLTTRHAHLALGADTGHGLARRYPVDIGPLSGLREQSPEAYADLAELIPPGDAVALVLEEAPHPPAGWQILGGGTVVHMICRTVPEPPDIDDAIIPMQLADYPEMVALATLTEPGPFRDRTPALGGFHGIRVDGRLAAITGQRLSPTGFSEVSAVCTHPDFRGRGYAKALVTTVTRDIYAEGRTPFLTVLKSNVNAIRVYEQVGFTLRHALEFVFLKPPSPTSHD